tara:strand:- start:1851 stop:2102 length:252 start_codon:yes stop_codon:yes gene_type:complete
MAHRTHNIPDIGEVLFEFITHGNYVKVVAVDPVTNTEITLVGDRRARRSTLENAAIQKLKYVIRKNAGKAASEQHDDDDDNLY